MSFNGLDTARVSDDGLGNKQSTLKTRMMARTVFWQTLLSLQHLTLHASEVEFEKMTRKKLLPAYF